MSRRVEDSLDILRDLPDLVPPEHLEAVTLEAMAAAADDRRPRFFARAALWIAATTVGALFGIWAMTLDETTEGVAPQVADSQRIVELAAQSARLEELLMMLPEQRRVMRADTASTIVGLENRIAWIDAALYQPETQAAPPEVREALLSDRVDVMNALVSVRYAQSRAFVFD